VLTLNWTEVSLPSFQNDFISAGRPVLLKGDGLLEAVLGASEKWSLQSLRRQHGDSCFRCVCQEPGAQRHRHVTMRLNDYLDYCRCHNDLEPLYLFEPEIPTELASQLTAPKFLGRDHVSAIAGSRYLPERRWLAIGGAGSGTRMHVDPLETSAWNLVVGGRKRWVLLPPGVQPAGLDWRDNGTFVAPGAALWFRGATGDGAEMMHASLERSGAVEVEQGPGELLFVPHGWWHVVLNLEMTVAYTENCVLEGSVEAVTDALKNLGEPIPFAELS